jgi:hypothetical protein
MRIFRLKEGFFILFISAFGHSVVAQQIPPVPLNFVVSGNVDDDFHLLSWTDVSSLEVQYQIDRRAPNEDAYKPLVTLAANTVTYRDNSAWSYEQYLYRIRAIGVDGNSDYLYMGGTTAVITNCGQTLCYPEDCSMSGYGANVRYTKTITASCTDCYVTLSFTEFSTEANFDKLTVYDGNSTKAPILGVFSGTTLPPVVYGTGKSLTLNFHSDGGIPGPGWSLVTGCMERPGRPTITSVEEIYSSEVTVNWEDKSDNEIGFKIDKSTSPEFLTYTTETLSANSKAFNFIYLDSVTTYYFRVRAFTDRIESYNSVIASKTTPGAPFRRTLLQAEGFDKSLDVRFADMNNDNLIDYIVSDYTSLAIFTNSGSGNFAKLFEITDSFFGSYELTDIDNDMDVDILYHTNYDKIYGLINHGDSFQKSTFAMSPGHLFGLHICAGDYDSDGYNDLFMYDTNSTFAAWMKNNKNGEFSIDSLTLFNRAFAHVQLADVDDNGEIDLFVNEGGGWYNQIYFNKNGLFKKTQLQLPSNFSSAFAIDLDNNGTTDFMLPGFVANYPFLNSGTSFTTGASFSRLGDSTQGVPADIDNDGDTDLVLNQAVYINKGNNKLAPITNFQFSTGSDAFRVLDWDNDGKQDIISYNAYNKRLYLWKNQLLAKTNSAPGAPVQLTATVGSGSVKLTWTDGTDDHTPASALRYNYYVGTRPQGQEVKSAANIRDGAHVSWSQLLPQSANEATLKNLEAGKYFWGVQTIDGSLRSSSFAVSTFEITSSPLIHPPKDLAAKHFSPYEIDLTWTDESMQEEGFLLLRSRNLLSGYRVIATLPANTTSFHDSDLACGTGYHYRVCAVNKGQRSALSPILQFQTLPLMSISYDLRNPTGQSSPNRGMIQWIDLNNDNRRDFVWAGMDEPPSWENIQVPLLEAYLQSANDPWVFEKVPLKIKFDQNWNNKAYAAVQSADFDNDERIDLVVGRSSGIYHQLVVMKNTGDYNFEALVLETKTYSDPYTSIDIGDYDNDGDIDILAARYSGYTVVYRNDQVNGFSKTFSLEKGHSAQWMDYNNDGWLDIVSHEVRYVGDYSYLSVYENTTQTFELVKSYPGGSGSLTIADFDNDNDEDIFTGNLNNMNDPFMAYIRNDRESNDLTLANMSIPQSSWHYMKFLDYNNDNYLDLLRIEDVNALFFLKGKGTSSFQKETIMSTGYLFKPEFAVNDIDGDSDVDVICMGYNPINHAGDLNILENNTRIVKAIPSAPFNLEAIANANSLTLSWAAGDSRPGMTYNVMVGTAPFKQNIVNGYADAHTGSRRVSAPGNTRFVKEKKLVGLAAGVYFWSVQTVDQNFQGSAFTSGSFAIGEPVLASPSLDASAISSRSIQLSLQPAPSELTQIVYWSDDGKEFQELQQTKSDQLIHGSLEENKTYYYKIISTDGANYSTYSAVVQATTLQRPVILSAEVAPVDEEVPFAVDLLALAVAHAPGYPSGYKILIGEGENYTVSGGSVTPNKNSNGTSLVIPIRIASAVDTSDVYSLTVDVNVITNSEAEAPSGSAVYPNPTRDFIVALLDSFQVGDPVHILIVDGFGRVVYESTSTGESRATLDVRHLPGGVYFLHLEQDGHRITRRFIKM